MNKIEYYKHNNEEKQAREKTKCIWYHIYNIENRFIKHRVLRIGITLFIKVKARE